MSSGHHPCLRGEEKKIISIASIQFVGDQFSGNLEQSDRNAA